MYVRNDSDMVKKQRPAKYRIAAVITQIICVVCVTSLAIASGIFNFKVELAVYAFIACIAFGIGTEDLKQLLKDYIKRKLR